MSKLSELHRDLQTISVIMAEPALSSEDQMERRCDALVSDLDELLAFAVNPETVDLVEAQYLAVSQMLARIEIVASVLNLRKARRYG